MTEVNTTDLIDRLGAWATVAKEQYGAANVYVFGSLVYREGVQFIESSDVDLVVVMPKLDGALARHRWVELLGEHKAALESDLLRFLGRADANEPIVSVVAVTDFEITCDVHKDGHREFFSQNTFLDLSTGKSQGGLPGVATLSPDRFLAAAVGFAQKIRNEFLATSPNGKARLRLHISEEDPLPKRFMRAGAMAIRSADPTLAAGAEHDVQEGLDGIFHRLNTMRSKTQPAWTNLHNLVSVRRRARGIERGVSPSEQLLLAELIYDIAVAGAPPATGPAFAPSPDPSVGPSTPSPPIAREDLAPVVRPSRGIVDVMPAASSSAFFADRFGGAFPGVRKIAWYEDAEEIAMRLASLLQPPIVFADGTPIWWWRFGNLQIEHFSRLEDGTFLMNYDELAISHVAAVPGSTYKRSFVYVEAAAMPQTGLYLHKPEDIHADVSQSGFSTEEYGLYRGEHLLTRSQYDDGGAMIGGQLVDTRQESALRVRHITPYNFLIAPVGSPINNSSFDDVLERVLNDALVGDRLASVEEVQRLVEKLPLRESRFS